MLTSYFISNFRNRRMIDPMATIDMRRCLYGLGQINIHILDDAQILTLGETSFGNGQLYIPSQRGHRAVIPPRMAADAAAPCNSATTAWTLGQLSAKYESGSNGPGTVSSGEGDAGGVSYGTYQMTSKPHGGTVKTFVASSSFPWRSKFVNLTPGSAEFTAQWKAIAKQSKDALHEAEHDFIKKTHYDPLVNRVEQDCQINVDGRTHALRDVMWSTAVQHGPATDIVSTAITRLCLPSAALIRNLKYDYDIIGAVYAERGAEGKDGALTHFRRNSKAVQDGVRSRFKRELADALKEFYTLG